MEDHDFIDYPTFADKYEAAAWAVQWAKENPNVYLTYGGPMYPVPTEEFQAPLKQYYATKIRATAGCEICNYGNVVANVANQLMGHEERREAERCSSAWCQGKAYKNYEYSSEVFEVEYPYK